MAEPKVSAVNWWRGIMAAGLAAVAGGVGTLVWNSVLSGHDAKPKIEAIDKRLVQIEQATSGTKEALIEIKTTLNASVILRIDGLDRRITALETARTRQDETLSDVRAELAGIKATLQEILRASTPSGRTR